MRLDGEYVLIDGDAYGATDGCVAALAEIREAILHVVWPPGGDKFTIYPESGKKSGEGNGVVPIRTSFAIALAELGWSLEAPFPLESGYGEAAFGAMDASKDFDGLPFIVEWETGNISSSHRALNKMALGLLRGVICGGVLVVPTRPLARFLTDRIGNLREIVPYFPLWASVPVQYGLLAVFAVEHDATSIEVPRIAKGTDGRALR